MKADEVGALREQTLGEGREPLFAAAAAVRAELDAGGRLLALGNGGSATDAMDAVADFRAAPRAGRPALARPHRGPGHPHRDRQRHRPGRHLRAPDDRLRRAGRRAARAVHERQLRQRDRGAGRGAPAGLATIALVGYDGGRVAAEPLADHVVVTRSRAHPADPGGPGERVPRAARAGRGARRRPVRARGSRAGTRVEGTVQGVGFRPFVYRLACGARPGRLRAQRRARRAARGRGRRQPRSTASCAGSRRRRRRWPSSSGAAAGASRRRASAASHPRQPARRRAARARLARHRDLRGLPRELFDPADRRYRYPFVNCTNCGPRFTIVRGVPYDRPLTTMAGFEMCSAAPPSTTTPPTAASTPSPTRARTAGRRCGCCRATRYGDEALRGAVAALREGAVVAVKGIGGYHLACLRRRRAGGRRAAGAQAPRGQAVRADGARRRGGARSWCR